MSDKKYPGQLKFHKRSGALQASLIPWNSDDSKPGAILLEVAEPTDPNDRDNKTYRWSNKITFALGPADLDKILDPRFESPMKLYHDYKGTVKTMTLQRGEGKYEGTYMIFFQEGDNKIKVPLARGEMITLITMIQNSLIYIYGWHLAVS